MINYYINQDERLTVIVMNSKFWQYLQECHEQLRQNGKPNLVNHNLQVYI